MRSLATILILTSILIGCSKEELQPLHIISIYGTNTCSNTMRFVQACSDSSYNYTFYDIEEQPECQDSMWKIVYKYNLLGDANVINMPVVEVLLGIEGYGLQAPSMNEVNELLKNN